MHFFWSVTHLEIKVCHLKIVITPNHNSKNENRKIDFSFVSAQRASFMKIWKFLREGVCISLIEKKNPIGIYCYIHDELHYISNCFIKIVNLQEIITQLSHHGYIQLSYLGTTDWHSLWHILVDLRPLYTVQLLSPPHATATQSDPLFIKNSPFQTL